MRKIYLLSGPSGSGKTTLVRKIEERYPDVWRVVSCTTRPRRPGETQDFDYHFMTRPLFRSNIGAGALVEYVEYEGDYYGIPVGSFDVAPKSIAVVTPETAVLLKHTLGAVTIFVRPPSRHEASDRVRARKQPHEEQRVLEADTWMKFAPQFDYIITNDSLDRAVEEFGEIMQQVWREPTRRSAPLQRPHLGGSA